MMTNDVRRAGRALVMGGAAVALMVTVACTATPDVSTAAAKDPASAQLARGKYLVAIGGCNDCHTPLKMGPRGPEPDMSRALTGHPEDLKMPPAPALPPGPWIASFAATNTAWAGPWGVSFTSNLTPDKETGLGDWTEAQFIAAIRTGKHQGKGRAILPPMPYPAYANLVDEELKAIWAYLRSLAPVKNRVPQPIDPPESQR